MNYIDMSNKVKSFLNSIFFPIILASITVLSFILGLGLFPYYIAAISAILLLIFKANYTCMFEIFMLCIAGSNIIRPIDNIAPLIILVLLWSLAASLLIKELIARRFQIIEVFKKDYVFYSLILIYITMFISLVNTPCLSDSFAGIGYFGFIVFTYCIARILITPSLDNKNSVVRNIIICGWIVFFEFLFMFITKINENYRFIDIINIKLLSFSWAHENHYAAFVNICMLLSIYYFIVSKNILNKVFAFISIILFIVINSFTLCKAGILALIFVLPFSLIIYIVNAKKTGWIAKKYDLLFIGLTIIVIIIFIAFLIVKGYLSEIVLHFKIYTFFTDNGRLWVFNTALERFKEHPIIGAGVYSTHYYLKDFYNYHNYYMQMLGTCGILGTLAFTLYLIVSIKRVIKHDLYCAFIGIVTMYFLFHGLLDTIYFNHVIMPILMVLLALIYDKPKEESCLDNQNQITSSEIQEGEIIMENTNVESNEIKVKNGFFYLLFKRMFDIISSGLFLILFSWLILILLFIKFCEDGHNPVYTSIRVGKHGKLIKFHKIRSMKPNADQLKQQLIDQGLNEADGPLFKMKNDPRITRFGKFLRKTSLDEILQIWDVFVGRISVVGPRSPLPKEFEQFNERAKHKVDVKGGLLCLWQIQHNRNALSFDESIELDIKYMETRSLWLDFKIIIKGAWMVIFDHSGE